MPDLGLIALIVGFVAALFGIAASLLGGWKKRLALVVAGRNALYVVSAFVFLGSLALILSLVRRDYSLAYVADHVSNAQPLFYNLSSFWGGQAGSLLFWTLIFSGYATAVTLSQWKRQPDTSTVRHRRVAGNHTLLPYRPALRRQSVYPRVVACRWQLHRRIICPGRRGARSNHRRKRP